MIFGAARRNYLSGGDKLDQLDGGNGHDLLLGSAGGDVFWGRHGNDTLNGEAGGHGFIDLLESSSGEDTLQGDDDPLDVLLKIESDER